MECTHEWHEGKCTKCNKTCEHDWYLSECRICGAPCNHVWEVFKGESLLNEYFTCKICGEETHY